MRNRFSGRYETITRYSRSRSAPPILVQGRSTNARSPLRAHPGAEVVRNDPRERVPRDLGVILEPARQEDPAHVHGEDDGPDRVHVPEHGDEEARLLPESLAPLEDRGDHEPRQAASEDLADQDELLREGAVPDPQVGEDREEPEQEDPPNAPSRKAERGGDGDGRRDHGGPYWRRGTHPEVERNDEKGGLHENRGGGEDLQDVAPKGAAEEEGQDRPHAPGRQPEG